MIGALIEHGEDFDLEAVSHTGIGEENGGALPLVAEMEIRADRNAFDFQRFDEEALLNAIEANPSASSVEPMDMSD